jgi:CRP/FNR family transcriptional regulator, cyclic AMP receptor protein
VADNFVPLPDVSRVRAVVAASELAGMQLFVEFTDDELASIASSSELRSLRRGDVLFTEGSTPTELFVVRSGRVAIANRSIDGRESVVALMEPGAAFGEMGLFLGEGRTAEARALEVSEVVAIPYDGVRRVYEDRPELLWGVVALLSGRIRDMDGALADAVFLDVTGRTAKRLLEMAGESDEFTMPVTQEELAGMVGASRERVNKALAQFVRLGWIEQSERRYRITDRQQLEIRAR